MGRKTSSAYLALLACLLVMGLLATRPASAAAPRFPARTGPAPAARFSGGGVGQSFFSPGGFFGGFGSPFVNSPSLPPPYPFMPNYWWVGPYPTADPRQSGYNPASGYRWEDVTALILDTYPKKARITLDGITIGQTTELGPIQLPMGEHSLRVEAAGYETSETLLKVEKPILQQLEIRLEPVNHAAPLPARP